MEFSYLDNLILAPKVQGRVHFYFVNASLSALYYSNLKDKYAVKLRPEIGVGLWSLDMNYGYNIGIVKNEFEKVNKHVLSVKYYLRLKRTNYHEYDRKGNLIKS